MFDVSFTELMVIGVVALIVIGPERLPRVAKTIGHLLGRAQRYVSDVKGDIRREIELDDLRKFKSEMDDAAQSVQSTLRDTEKSFRGHSDELRDVLEKTAKDAQAGLSGVTSASTLSGAASSASTNSTDSTAPASSDTLASTAKAIDTTPDAAAQQATDAAKDTTAAAGSDTVQAMTPAQNPIDPTDAAQAPVSAATAAFGTGDTPAATEDTDATPDTAPVAAKPARANDWPPPPTWSKP